jgi:hypothetical protein
MAILAAGGFSLTSSRGSMETINDHKMSHNSLAGILTQVRVAGLMIK